MGNYVYIWLCIQRGANFNVYTLGWMWSSLRLSRHPKEGFMKHDITKRDSKPTHKRQLGGIIVVRIVVEDAPLLSLNGWAWSTRFLSRFNLKEILQGSESWFRFFRERKERRKKDILTSSKTKFDPWDNWFTATGDEQINGRQRIEDWSAKCCYVTHVCVENKVIDWCVIS